MILLIEHGSMRVMICSILDIDDFVKIGRSEHWHGSSSSVGDLAKVAVGRIWWCTCTRGRVSLNCYVMLRKMEFTWGNARG